MIRRKFGIALFIGVVICSVNGFGSGQITKIWFSGPDDPSHANVVQLQIDGGLNVEGCDKTYAAIRTGGERDHMISFALAAYVSGTPVEIELNKNDKYWGNSRCTILRISNRL